MLVYLFISICMVALNKLDTEGEIVFYVESGLRYEVMNRPKP